MLRIRKLGALAGMVLATAVMWSGAVEAQTIKIAFLGSQEDEDYDGSLVFKDFVKSRTNGEVTVEIYPNGQFCSKFIECIEQVCNPACSR
jgi:TRAP-type C4-dicarboxylate transport system substrate-binding protein